MNQAEIQKVLTPMGALVGRAVDKVYRSDPAFAERIQALYWKIILQRHELKEALKGNPGGEQ